MTARLPRCLWLLATVSACAAPDLAPAPAAPPDPAGPASGTATAAQLAARRAFVERMQRDAPRPRSARAGLAAETGQDLVNALDLPAALNPTFVAMTRPAEEAMYTRDHLGRIVPRKGEKFLIMSTGLTGDDQLRAEPGYDFAPTGSTGGDVTTLRFQVTVPPGSNRLSFDYTFLSAESPDFVGSSFNDTFTARVTDALGAGRIVASASVNEAVFHPASDVNVGPGPFLLYVDNAGGVNSTFNTGLELDAGTTDFQHVDVEVASGVIELELDIRDLGDGILDSAVIIDNLSFAAIELVDGHADLVADDGKIFGARDPRLVSLGTQVNGVAADGATQLVVRSRVPGPGSTTFTLASASDGALAAADGALAWATTATVAAELFDGKWYAIALYQSPADYRRTADDDLVTRRDATLTMSFTPTTGAGFSQPTSFAIVRPPVVVIPDLWTSCLDWEEPGALKDPTPSVSLRHRFLVRCAEYGATSAKSTGVNLGALPTAINTALTELRDGGTAATRVDVIAHGLGAVMARRYIDDKDFASSDSFKAGRINRLIAMNAPNLGSRLMDELVRFRDFQKSRATWASIKNDILAPIGIAIDNDDGDVAVDELQTTSAVIAGIGARAPSDNEPRRVGYHALVSTGGRSLPRLPALGLLPPSVKTLLIEMENGHPATYQANQINKQKLIYGAQSLIFCSATDQHDLFATTTEQAGGLAATSPFTVVSALPFSGHSLTNSDPAHTSKLLELLNAPVGGGQFAPTMPLPSTLPAKSPCPVANPTALAARAQVAPLAAGTIAFALPAPGTVVHPGDTITVAIDPGSGAQPQSVLIVAPGNTVHLEEPPFTASFEIPNKAIDGLGLHAMAFYDDGSVAVAPVVPLGVQIEAALTEIRVVDDNIVLPRPGRTRQLRVVGTYSDGVRREITNATGTEYRASNLTPVAEVSGTGLVTAVGAGNATVAIRNGDVITSINVKVGAAACGDGELDPGEQCDDGNTRDGDGCDATCQIANLPPLAVCASPTVCNDAGQCVATVSDLGAGSSDPEGAPLTIAQTPEGPYAVGGHAIEVSVSDGALAASCVAALEVLDCEAPALTCPAAFATECTNDGGAEVAPPAAVALDNCGAPTLHAPPPARLALGTHTLSYAADDAAGNATSCTTLATVQDTTPPQLTCPAPIVAECKGRHGAFVVPAAASASDACTPATVTRPSPAAFPLGTTALTYTASDQTGHTASCAASIQVVDTQPPRVFTGHPAPLLPANHQYRTVRLDDCDIHVDDQCGGWLPPSAYDAQITCVTVNEPDNAPGNGDGNTANDVVIVDAHTVKLRAERRNHGDGRVYSVHFRVKDHAGNLQNGTCAFSVPDDDDCDGHGHGDHDHGHGHGHGQRASFGHHGGHDRDCRVDDDTVDHSVCR